MALTNSEIVAQQLEIAAKNFQKMFDKSVWLYGRSDEERFKELVEEAIKEHTIEG